MPDVLIRDMPEAVKRRLAERAKRHGRSLSAEIMEIVSRATAESPPQPENEGLGTQINRLFAGLDWDPDLIPPRDKGDRPPPFS